MPIDKQNAREPLVDESALLAHVAPRPFPFLSKLGRAYRDLFGIDQTPGRTYWFSDAYGGSEQWNPLNQEDLDVKISGDFESRNRERIHREYDIWGQEESMHHFLRLVLQQHDELAGRRDLSAKTKRRALKLGTGVFINSAPRVDRSNARPFWVATARGGSVRIVATPVELLAGIKNQIETLAYLPNPQEGDPSNGLYEWTEQFRSRLTPRLLNPDHRLDLAEADPSAIPDFRKDWHVAFVDRYGNVITWAPDTALQWAQIEELATRIGNSRRTIRLLLQEGNDEPRQTPNFQLALSLGSAEPAECSIYRNGRGIDLVRKYQPHETAEERLAKSAFKQLPNARIGTTVRLPE